MRNDRTINQRRLRLAAASCIAASLLGCDWDMNRRGREDGVPPVEPQVGPGAANTAQPLLAPQASENARPSIDENMGRGFQGAIEWNLTSAAGESRGLRYLARGNKARLQLDGVAGQGAFDALIWAENLSTIDNAQRTYRSVDLDEVPVTPRERRVRVEKTGERQMLNGVGCERFEIDDGPLHVTACVTGLPGTFEVDKFEAASGLHLPAWAAELLDRELMPLSAAARDESGREVYALALTRYSAGPVADSMFALPSNYRALSGPQVR